MIVLIDNYDSFTYNLVQYLGDLGQKVRVHRNDKITADEVLALSPKGIIISPGPSDPDHAGICLEMVEKAADSDTPLFGVCLGHQTIGQVYGGNIIQTTPMHGKVSAITHNGTGIFKDLPSPLEVTRYHSLLVEEGSFSDELEITARTEDGLIMGLSHKTKPIHGVQFHPESIATSHGHDMLKNFITLL
ncbi:MAG: aminodeoxychorismate/anthranilate synthase component II [Alphaproteobacteria bacterium]|nr:aminodeoxychorismate/anthranilate synthase component II [Alphaproteobacteria bacterium]